MFRIVARAASIQLPFRAFSNGAAKTPLIVQKFGGTSLGTPAKLEKMLNIVKQYYPKNNVIAVVSGACSQSLCYMNADM